MQRFTLQMRKYTMFDYGRILLQIAPFSLIFIIVTAILLSFEPTLMAICTANFVDTATAVFNGTKPADAITEPLIFVVAVVAFNWVQRNITHFCWVDLRLRLTDQYITALNEKKARLEYTHIENSESWDLIKRVCGKELASGKSDYEAVEKFIGGWESIQQMIIAITRILGLLSVFLAYAWWSAIVVVILSVPLYIISVRNGKRNYGAEKQVQADTRRVEYLGDVLRSREYAEERSLFGFSDRVGGMFHKHLDISVNEKASAQLKSMQDSNLGTVFSVSIWFIIAIALLPSTASGDITLGMYIGLIGCVTDLVQCVGNRLSWAAEDLSQQQEYISDLTAFANLSETPNATDKPAPVPEDVEIIRFENVRFAYPGTDKLILDGLDLEIRKGIKYAFVGANGAGKTTVTKLLTGLYTNYEGRITVNGKELRELTTGEQKALYAVVHQDFARYFISLRDNITLGNVNIMDSDNEAIVQSVVSATGLAPIAAKLPAGLDTELGRLHKGGQDLSGGEWQRVAIARSTISNAPVVILDEPTAALDPIAESNLYAEFDKISRGKTSIFISHRLGSTKLADVIYVFADGRVKESGTHAALMEQNGLYAEMYDAQKEWYV